MPLNTTTTPTTPTTPSPRHTMTAARPTNPKYSLCLVMGLLVAAATWDIEVRRGHEASLAATSSSLLSLQQPQPQSAAVQPQSTALQSQSATVQQQSATVPPGNDVKQNTKVRQQSTDQRQPSSASSILPTPPLTIRTSQNKDKGQHSKATKSITSPTTTIPTTNEIPKRLIFIYKDNLLQTRQPKVLYDNVRRTIAAYQQAWGQQHGGGGRKTKSQSNNIQVDLYTDQDCIRLIRATPAPALAAHFESEGDGSYKADICRIAALYLTGGYYFDVDMKVIEPYIVDGPHQPPPKGGGKHKPKSTTTTSSFVTVHDAGRDGYFQSFLATTPRHVVLQQAMVEMERYYRNDNGVRDEIYDKNLKFGPMTLKWAHEALLKQQPKQRDTPAKRAKSSSQNSPDDLGVYLLQEDFLNGEMYPSLKRQDGEGCCCNVVVHNQDRPFFFSRVPGAGQFCRV